MCQFFGPLYIYSVSMNCHKVTVAKAAAATVTHVIRLANTREFKSREVAQRQKTM